MKVAARAKVRPHQRSDATPLPCRRDKPVGALPLVAARCPALRDLELSNAPLEHPSIPLAHLTRMYLCHCPAPAGGAARPLRLAAAAPRLEALMRHALVLLAGIEVHPVV